MLLLGFGRGCSVTVNAVAPALAILFGLDEVGHNESTNWMHAERPERVPFDDRAALEELERVRRAIVEWRERRKEILATFDEFVRGFRTPPAERETRDSPPGSHGEAFALPKVVPEPPPSPVVQPAVPEPPPSPVVDPAVAELPPLLVVHPAVAEPPLLPVVQPASELTPLPVVEPALRSSGPPAGQLKRPAQLAIVAGGVAVLITAGVLMTRSRPAAPAESSGQRSSAIPSAGPQSKAGSEDPALHPVAPVSGGTEIVALRRVWVRVIVDGTKAVERELRADERVALPSGRTIVIRTGDAGAIRLTMNGQDRGTLGPEGEVVTRTFTAPAPANR
jgi:hypothetical protein